jgi:hypothetical protein
MNKIEYNKIHLGDVDGERIYLSPPSWDCGWYWGWSYLGNDDCHYHVSGLEGKENLRDAFITHFGESLNIIPKDLWVVCELFNTYYTINKVASLYKDGCTGLCNNPISAIIINTEEAARINEIVLPAVFASTYKILERNKNNAKLYNKLVDIDLLWGTTKTLEFLKTTHFKIDDLIDLNNKSTQKLLEDDITRIHEAYWDAYHKTKKDEENK